MRSDSHEKGDGVLGRLKGGAYLSGYLRARRRPLLCGLCCLLALVVVTVLGQLPWDVMGYTVLLCAALLFCFAVVGYIDYVRRLRALEPWEQYGETPDSVENLLPETQDPLEKRYQALLLRVCQEKQELRERARQEARENTDYYAMWTHQIKTPISAMRLLLQTAPSERSDELQAELFRIEQYVEMALSYQRLSSDSSDLVLRKYSLATIVKGAVRKYARLFVRKGIRVQLGDMEAAVLTDEKWLGFAIGQILSNSLKYTPSGGQVILAKEDPCTLLIADTGIGIAPEDLPRVFEKGYTGLNGRQERSSTGIGLYLTQCALKKLGHSIEIQSRPGRGTLVRIDLSHRESLLE